MLERIGLLVKYGFSRELAARLEVGPVVPEIVNRVNDLLAETQARAGKPVLVTIDGLDRLEVDAARAVFAHSTLLTRPACHVIYTIPLPLRYDPGFTDAIANFRVCDLPNFKVNSRNGEPYPEGRERLTQVIQRRIADYVSASNPVFEPQAASMLVEKSGGLLRDLIRLCQTACRGAFRETMDRVDGQVAEAAVRALTREQAGNLLSVHREVLREVHRTKRLSDRVAELTEGGEIRKVVVCHQLLKGRHVLAYVNDETWFDVHPFLLAGLAA